MWIIGLLSYDSSDSGSLVHVPESIRVAFSCFSDIRNIGSYTTPNRSLLPQGQPSQTSRFNLTQWWLIGEGEMMGGPFDVRDEMVDRLLHLVELVRKSC